MEWGRADAGPKEFAEAESRWELASAGINRVLADQAANGDSGKVCVIRMTGPLSPRTKLRGCYRKNPSPFARLVTDTGIPQTPFE